MIGVFLAAYAGMRAADTYLTPQSELPVWTGHIGGDVGKPAVSITLVRWRGKTSYRLYVATDGQSALAMSGTYADILGALQTWEKYLSEGGTVTQWLANNAQRANEVATLEKSL